MNANLPAPLPSASASTSDVTAAAASSSNVNVFPLSPDAMDIADSPLLPTPEPAPVSSQSHVSTSSDSRHHMGHPMDVVTSELDEAVPGTIRPRPVPKAAAAGGKRTKLFRDYTERAGKRLQHGQLEVARAAQQRTQFKAQVKRPLPRARGLRGKGHRQGEGGGTLRSVSTVFYQIKVMHMATAQLKARWGNYNLSTCTTPTSVKT